MPDLRRNASRRRALSKYRRGIVGAASALLLLAAAAPAKAADEDVGLKVPRFVSLHSDKVNLRTGPGRQYPIEWVLTRKDMPVEVIAQFEHWRRIRDWEGTVGWVQEHMVAGRRTAIVGKGAERPLHQQPDAASGVVARAAPGVARASSNARARGAGSRPTTSPAGCGGMTSGASIPTRRCRKRRRRIARPSPHPNPPPQAREGGGGTLSRTPSPRLRGRVGVGAGTSPGLARGDRLDEGERAARHLDMQ